MTKRRICCFCEKWASGGIESFLCNVLTHMDLSDMEVDIVASRLEESLFTERLKAAGVQFVALAGSPYRLRENAKMFRRLLAQRRYDVVHLNVFHGLSLRYAQMAKQAGVPVRIGHSHCPSIRPGMTWLMKATAHELSKRAYARMLTERWACSEKAAAFLFPGGMSAQILCNGVDVERFRFSEEKRERIRSQYGLKDKLVIGHVGRLCAEKNQSFLLEVFHDVFCKRPDACLLLVGEGSARKQLEQQAVQLGIEKAVVFAGVTQDMEAFYAAMDVFVLPSLFEGLSLAAVEAQCAGLPVVCSDTVPKEAFLLNESTALPLSADRAYWVQTILTRQETNRAHAADTVLKAGYDVRDAAAQIRRIYAGEDKG